MKMPPVMWTRTRLLVLMGLLVTPLHVRAQKGVEFSPSDAHAVSVHVGNGIELQAKFNGQGPIDLIFDTGSANIMSAYSVRGWQSHSQPFKSHRSCCWCGYLLWRQALKTHSNGVRLS
jgi:hypothetical protein